MTTAVLPGSFDPITIGHVDLIRRATRVADHIIVGVGVNARKNQHFTVEERVGFIRDALSDISGVAVEPVDGLVVDFCRSHHADLIIKGIRDSADISWEITQASVNREIGDVETLFLPTRPDLMHVSSSIVRELASWGMDVSRYVPPAVAAALADNGSVRNTWPGTSEGGSDA
ncbi:MAG TPA: pantetheine-phosphate adenylyltransferase [Lacisediminihabitans sp.]|uniref:pantetheine-phosphate adenylyltransferase n=1 Tax=Lacisediminihabitans sp. TaxID=2787631 RepID=UPI002ED8AB1F